MEPNLNFDYSKITLSMHLVDVPVQQELSGYISTG